MPVLNAPKRSRTTHKTPVCAGSGELKKSANIFDIKTTKQLDLSQIATHAKPDSRVVNIRLNSEQIIILNFLNYHVDESDAFVVKQSLRAMALLIQQKQAGTPMMMINNEGVTCNALDFLNIR